MPSGLQIWDADRSGKMVLDLTTRCTNFLGYVDLPIYYWSSVAGAANNLPPTGYLSINVPNFSFGSPFWMVFNRFKDVRETMTKPTGWNDHMWDNYAGYSRDQNPDCYVSGTTLYYCYPNEAMTPAGDYAYWLMGGHRLMYGVT